ncbi:MAG: hypothetical protein AAF718_04295 [Pseudomonadota bacterium]
MWVLTDVGVDHRGGFWVSVAVQGHGAELVNGHHTGRRRRCMAPRLRDAVRGRKSGADRTDPRSHLDHVAMIES